VSPCRPPQSLNLSSYLSPFVECCSHGYLSQSPGYSAGRPPLSQQHATVCIELRKHQCQLELYGSWATFVAIGSRLLCHTLDCGQLQQQQQRLLEAFKGSSRLGFPRRLGHRVSIWKYQNRLHLQGFIRTPMPIAQQRKCLRYNSQNGA
jgi:hypothetical protein